MRRAITWGLAVALVAAPTAAAAEQASIQAVLNLDGSGRMIANSQTNPDDETWSREACPVNLTTCSPFTRGRIVETAGAPVPSVFRVTSSYGAITLSPRWNGNVSPASPPSVAGMVKANELVVPLAGQWTGGWEGDVDWTQLAACVGPEDEGCTTLTHRHYVGGCANGAAVIDPIFTGRYLRVADRRVPAHTPELAFAVGSPYTADIWHRGPTVSVAVVGRIKPATGPAASGCGPSPLVKASISSKGVATVRCDLGCRAVLVARQGKREARVARTISPSSHSALRSDTAPRLQLRPGQVKRFAPGAVRMIAKAYGRRAAARTVLLD